MTRVCIPALLGEVQLLLIWKEAGVNREDKEYHGYMQAVGRVAGLTLPFLPKTTMLQPFFTYECGIHHQASSL